MRKVETKDGIEMRESKLFIATALLGVENDRHSSAASLKALADSITMLGQIQPIVVDRNMNVVAGRRRLAALKLLDITAAHVTIAETAGDALRAVLIESHENTCREPLVPWDALETYDRIVAIHKAAALERMTKGKRPSGLRPEGPKGNARDLAAKAVGRSKNSIIMLRDVQLALTSGDAAIEEVAASMKRKLMTNEANIADCWQQLQDVMKGAEDAEVVDDPEPEPEPEPERTRTPRPKPAPKAPAMNDAQLMSRLTETLATFCSFEPERMSKVEIDWARFIDAANNFNTWVDAVTNARKPRKRKADALPVTSREKK